MVILHVKHGDQSVFLYQSTLQTPVEDSVTGITAIYNGRLKIDRICGEMEELAKHGTLYPPEILGLTDEQVRELKIKDPWGDKSVPSGGWTEVPDPIGRRNGKQPLQQMQDVLRNATADAKKLITTKLVNDDRALTMKIVQEALNILKGAVMIAYPMKLPPHDVVRMELENVEDLSGTQASLEVVDPATAQLWFCGREMYRGDGKTLGDFVGKIETTKVIVKLAKRGQGPPAREPILTEAQRKEYMLHAYRRQEELKKLEEDDDDSYCGSPWADQSSLKKSFHGLNHISWGPGK